MKTLKNTSKRALKFADAYLQSTTNYLWQCYEKFSTAKSLAWKNCHDRMRAEGGQHMRIISWNSMKFTVAWQIFNKDTHRFDLRVETADNSYIIPHYLCSTWKD